MTQQEIIDTKTIAEFDGWTIEPGMEKLENPFCNKGFGMMQLADMNYHTSFDSIIPIAKKIYDLCEDNPRVFLHLVMYCPNIYHNNILSVKIENIFKECAEFIRWVQRN